ncbi:VOC family protein [Sorangium sp. So ce145]|uniref:VOC family protein n=1 Tax=Sorangium sp. So ce145 TaxID=3133285 RepID=UPI003F63EDB3
MGWEIDHVFLATPDVGIAERMLAEFGLSFSRHAVHEGQGTANACAAFENAFFEVLGVHDLEELQTEIVRPLGLHERIHWAETGACPFGICFRTIDAGGAGGWPFETWDYKPKYMPTGMSMPIVTPRGSLAEPMIFVAPQTIRRITPIESRSHRGARRTLTRVRLQLPAEDPPLSSGVRWFVDQGMLSIDRGATCSLELEWDHGHEGQSHQFPAEVPLVVRW